MFTLACFDLDNTLFDHDQAEQKAYSKVIDYIQTTLHIPCTSNDIMTAKQHVKNITHTYERAFYFKHLLSQHKIPNLLKHVEACHTIYWTTFLQTIQPFPFVKETLSLFTRKKCITNFTLNHQLKKCKALHLLDAFDDILSSEEMGTTKPSPILFHEAIFPHKPETCCMVGDRLKEDIQGAKHIGMFAIHIDKMQSEPIHLQPNQLSVPSFTVLYHFLQSVLEHLATLQWLCHRVGERSDFTQHTGGNVSVKWHFEDKHLMLIKASGCHLANVTQTSGWSLLTITETGYMKICGEQPSIETCMHTLFPSSYVLHCHPPIVAKSPSIPYIPPGEELANALKPFKEEPVVYLENHGIVIQRYCKEQCLSDLDVSSEAISMHTFCNVVSDAMKGGITLLSKNCPNKFCFYTPDTAVFLCRFFTSLVEAKESKCQRFVLVHEKNAYCHAPTHAQAKAMLELLDVHVQLSSLGIEPLSEEECKRLQTRPDETFRLHKN